MVAGVYWEWMVNKGRKDGRDLGADYTEVRFEELVGSPQETLARLGSFIDHDLDYDRIQKVGIGSVSAPNTSFEGGFVGKIQSRRALENRLHSRESRDV